MGNAKRTASMLIEDALDGFETAKEAAARRFADSELVRRGADAAGDGWKRLCEWCSDNPGRGLSGAILLGFLIGRLTGGRDR